MNTCSVVFIEVPSRYTFERVLDENTSGINEIECYTQVLKVIGIWQFSIKTKDSVVSHLAIQNIKIQVTQVPQSQFYEIPVQQHAKWKTSRYFHCSCIKMKEQLA